MNRKQLLTFLLLFVAGVGNVLYAQMAVTVGSQVTSETNLQENAPYIIYQPRNNTYVKEASDKYSAVESNSADVTGVFYFVKVSDGVYKIKSYSTGKYISKPTTTGIAAIAPVEEASAGEWNLQFDTNGCIYPLCNGYGWDRGSSALWATANASTEYNESGNVKLYKIYEVALSTTALSEFAGRNIQVSSTEAASLSTGTWYVMSQRSRTSYVYEDASSHTLKHTLTKPSGSATDKAGYCVRLISGADGKYILQTGLGNLVGQIEESTNVPTASLPDYQFTIGKIASTDGHFYVQCSSNSVVLDANDFGQGDPSTVVGHGTTVPTATGGNNDWAFYPIELVPSWVPTIAEVYTINNTNTNRGALIYNPSNPAYVWSSGKSGTFNASEANSQWVIIPTGTEGQYYLYNVGAGKFAVPTGSAQGAQNPWKFSNNAVAVKFLIQSDGTYKIQMAKDPVSGTNAAYLAVSNGQTYPIINYNDVGGNFTITKVDGQDQSSAATAAVNKLIINQTALTAAPNGEGWYAIRVKTHTTYADQYVFTRESEATHSSTNYPLGFYSNVNVQPSISDAAYIVKLTKSTYGHYCQMPNGLYIQGASKPISGAGESSIAISYDATNHFTIKSGSYFWQPYYLSSNYFIGETATSGTTYYDLYPVDLTAAGLTAWQLTVEGLSADTKVTCTRSDVSGLNAVYTNGYFFLPTGQTPAQGEFTATVSGSPITLPVTIDSENHTITASVPVLTISSPQAEATFTWNGESKTGQTVTFTYTGQKITSNDISVSYSGTMFQSPTLSQSTWDGTASTTVTCTMTPAFFSSTYGEKWVRIVSAKTPTLVVDLANVADGASTTMVAHDYFDAAQLWCLVGNSSSFTLYNKAAGSDYVLTSGAASPAQNTTATLQPTASATNTTWTLGNGQLTASDAPGYVLYAATGDGNQSLHGWQSGNVVKYWGAASGGSHFLIENASGEVSLVLEGLAPTNMTVYTQNIANLPVTIDGTTTNSLLTKDNFANMTAYLPQGTELTLGTPKMFMNYGFTGYDGTNQTKTVTATATAQSVNATFTMVREDARYLWEPLRTNASDYYRIPAIVTAKNGDIIAINDRRFNNGSDIGGNHHIDIIGVASSDNGATWGSEFMVMDGNNGGEVGYGDAAVVADRESNKVLVMACGGNVSYQNSTTDNHQVIARTVLTHNGTTWEASAITTYTDQFYSGDLANCPAMFIGSGSITQSSIIKKGNYYRIYCAVLAKNYGNYVLYSDDFGETWTYIGSSSAAASGDEAKVTELPDGSVLLSSRKSYGRYFNVWTWNDDNYTSGSWGTAVATNNQTGGISFGANSTNGDIRMIPAIKKSTGERVILAMQSIPTGGSRSNVSIFYKELAPTGTYTDPTAVAQNWSNAFEVTPNNSAYSAFNSQPDGRVAFFMEETPVQMTEASVGYYLCYVPLTLDEITDNQYTGIASTYEVPLKTVGSASYATLYLPFDVTTDEHTKAYVIKSVDTGFATLTELTDGEIAANTAVVLVNETSNTATLNVANTTLEPQVTESENYLKGTLVSRTLDLSEASPYFALGKYDDAIGFYKFDNNGTTTITLGANKAYLEVPASSSGVKGFTFSFDPITGIGAVQPTAEGGQQTAEIFNLAGQRVSKPAKGVYIVGGRKILMK